jgi:biotin transport system substrate-specific component
MGDLDSALDGYRQVRARAHVSGHGLHWLAKLGLAAGFAGFTALMAQVSIPVPWTPVPLSLALFGVLLAGTALGARWGAVSMGLYLLAGALGLHVFAASDDAFNPPTVWAPERWRVLVPDAVAHTGFTAGYLFGFLAASAFAGWALRRRSDRADGKVFWAVVCALLALLGGIAVGGLFLRGSGSFAAAGTGDAYDASLDGAWLFAAAFLVAAPAVGWLVARQRGAGAEALNLYLVLLAAVALVHVPGVAVLKATLGWSWSKAFALGSAVFLPFDALKAGVAVLASLPFLPSRSSPPSSEA